MSQFSEIIVPVFWSKKKKRNRNGTADDGSKVTDGRSWSGAVISVGDIPEAEATGTTDDGAVGSKGSQRLLMGCRWGTCDESPPKTVCPKTEDCMHVNHEFTYI